MITKALGDVTVTNIDAFGLIPQWINPLNPIPLWEQINGQYGWHDFEGFELGWDKDGRFELSYPDDPTMIEVARITRGDEVLCMFQHSWCMWRNQVTGEFKVARLD